MVSKPATKNQEIKGIPANVPEVKRAMRLAMALKIPIDQIEKAKIAVPYEKLRESSHFFIDERLPSIDDLDGGALGHSTDNMNVVPVQSVPLDLTNRRVGSLLFRLSQHGSYHG